MAGDDNTVHASVIYGKDAAVDSGSVEGTSDGWMIEYRGNLSPYVASNTRGGFGREGGNKDWIGWYRKLGAIPNLFPGDEFDGVFSMDGTYGASGHARCEAIEWDWDLERGDYLTCVVRFGAHGALTIGDGAVSDTSIPDPPLVKGLSVKLDGALESHVHRMRLVARRRCRRYCSAECDGQCHRTSADLDMFGLWQVYENQVGNLPTIQQSYQVEFMTSASAAWTIQWMRIEDVRPFGVDRRDPERPIGATVYASFDATSGTMAGSVVDPNSTTKWPPT